MLERWQRENRKRGGGGVKDLSVEIKGEWNKMYEIEDESERQRERKRDRDRETERESETREKEREKERETESERETDRQTDRHTDRGDEKVIKKERKETSRVHLRRYIIVGPDLSVRVKCTCIVSRF